MSETLAWWFMTLVVGLAALPMCLLLFRRLPDRGYSLSKPFALILLGYWFWIGNMASILPNTTGAIVIVLLLLFAASAAFAWRRRDELLGFLRERWWLIVGVEVVFFLAFVTAAYLRSFVPDLGGTEKPMDFMFINAMTRAESFPPPDPWLAGESVSYYYFGYLLVSMMARLSGVSASIGFNLGLSMTAALAATAAFGLVFNLAASREQPAAEAGPGTPAAGFSTGVLWRPMVFGAVGALLLTVLGNLEGVLEALAATGKGWSSLWSFAGINDLAPYESGAWYADQFWFWWRATRIIEPVPGTFGIHEFPFFSFLLGDVHPHVMSIPFVLLAVGGAYALLRSDEPLDVVVWLERPLWLVAFAIMLGGLAFLNTWDMPTLAFVLALVTVVRNRLHADRWSWGIALDSLGFIAPLYLAAFLAYTPFFFGGFDSQASGFTAVSHAGTRPFHLLLIWGAFGALVLPYAIWRIRASGRPLTGAALWSLAPLAVIVLVWLAWDAFAAALGWLPRSFQLNDPTLSFADRLSNRDVSHWLTAIILGSSLGVLLLAFVREADRAKDDGDDRTGHLMALGLSTTAALLILGAEFFFIHDNFGNRMNTIFKLYYQSWLFLSVAGGFALYELSRGVRLPAIRAKTSDVSLDVGALSLGEIAVLLAGGAGGIAGVVIMDDWFTRLMGFVLLGGLAFTVAAFWLQSLRGLVPEVDQAIGPGILNWRSVWAGAVVVVLAGALVYPIQATWNRTDGCAGHPVGLLEHEGCADVFARRSLDGLEPLQRGNPSEHAAIQWLLDVEDQPVIAEGLGQSYTDGGRISASTGLPTPLQWPGHQAQWRGSYEPQEGRPEDLETLYTSTDEERIKSVLERYGISYVVVSDRERQQYSEIALPTMEELVQPAFEDGNITIYRVRPSALGEVTRE